VRRVKLARFLQSHLPICCSSRFSGAREGA